MFIPTNKEFWKDYKAVCNLCDELHDQRNDERMFFVSRNPEPGNSFNIGIMSMHSHNANKSAVRIISNQGKKDSFYTPDFSGFVQLMFSAARDAQSCGDIETFGNIFEAIKALSDR